MIAGVDLASGAVMEDGVLFRGYGYPIACGGLEAPILQRSKESVVQLWAHAVQNGFADNCSALVDRNLDYHVSFGVW